VPFTFPVLAAFSVLAFSVDPLTEISQMLRSRIERACLQLLTIIICLVSPGAAALGQDNVPARPPADDVVRIKTELVQTDVSIFDRQGRFVDGLCPEQFELTINGLPVSISFFELVMTGSASESRQLAATGGSLSPQAARNSTTGASDERGRIIFFFLDDLHLGKESLMRAREALTRFIDDEMGAHDQVAIVSTSGQIGFLQQLTDNKVVLRTAINRLNDKANPETYAGSTRISEYTASQIQDAGNKRLFAYLMESIKVEYGMGMGAGRGFHGNDSALQAANILQSRVRQISAQTRMQTADTLAVLGSLMLSSARLPGRKLVLFFSDGFIVDARKSNALDTLRRITEAAARSGAVVYTMDTRGTIIDPTVDASRNDYWDPSGRRSGLLMGETAATREPLQLLADETGGRAIFNSNSIIDEIRQAINETSDYYLLAWRPPSEAERDARARIKISIRERPDLRVRLRSSYYTVTKRTEEKTDSNAVKEKVELATTKASSPESELTAALGSSYSERALPTSLSVGYVNTTDTGPMLRIAMQIELQSLFVDGAGGSMEVDVLGAAIDDRGSIYTFKQLLKTRFDPKEPARSAAWTQQLRLRPGLYQVRVAVRERKSGRTGSAMQWIEVPDISQGRFDMSSIFLGERKPAGNREAAESKGPGAVSIDVDQAFARTSVLRFQTYIYNAARAGESRPDVWIQAQVLRNGRRVITTSALKVPTETTEDMSRLPFWSEISLAELSAGRYTLRITATERLAKRNVQRQINFTIE
jgi:VWFA-related protein